MANPERPRDASQNPARASDDDATEYTLPTHRKVAAPTPPPIRHRPSQVRLKNVDPDISPHARESPIPRHPTHKAPCRAAPAAPMGYCLSPQDESGRRPATSCAVSRANCYAAEKRSPLVRAANQPSRATAQDSAVRKHSDLRPGRE